MAKGFNHQIGPVVMRGKWPEVYNERCALLITLSGVVLIDVNWPTHSLNVNDPQAARATDLDRVTQGFANAGGVGEVAYWLLYYARCHSRGSIFTKTLLESDAFVDAVTQHLGSLALVKILLGA